MLSHKNRHGFPRILSTVMMSALFSITLLGTDGLVSVSAATDKTVYMRYPNGCTKAFTMAFDDNVIQDHHLVQLFQKYNLKSTFYMNTGRLGQSGFLTEEDAKLLYGNSGMEVAAHTRTHPDLPTLLAEKGESALKEEVLGDIAKIESLFGTKVHGLAYPGATPFLLYNDEVIDFLKKNGVGYGRITQSTYGFDLPNNWFTWRPTLHFGDQMLIKVTDKFLKAKITKQPRLFFVWGHAYEFFDAQFPTLEEFETQFCSKIAGKSNVWYVTNGDLYSYVQDYETGLSISQETDTITNKSSRTLWFSCNGQDIKLKAGETATGVFAGTHGSSTDLRDDTIPEVAKTTTQTTTTATKNPSVTTVASQTTVENGTITTGSTSETTMPPSTFSPTTPSTTADNTDTQPTDTTPKGSTWWIFALLGGLAVALALLIISFLRRAAMVSQ